ncbi:hypothetical protein FUA48_08375 [Flavobacterium alkalisoli]|uniref:Uncharacterized protein n=1 Tax=Flavobacterium alkalisoli TaxID=2602769 RepID=A0A5B9FRS0_9FLAO|nr:hypothetical protein [Flavobacterium alkalisoli]QEE49595.1 hypothetical protein FUA48_08375 [Flavobacterium alkalisoli]
MESIEFLKKQLNNIYESLPYLEIKYEYKLKINTHIIEVKPIHCYEKDSQYIRQQIVLEELFENMFPDEEILFMSENILIGIDNPILELGTSKVLGKVPVLEYEVVGEDEKDAQNFDFEQLLIHISHMDTNNEHFFYCVPKPTIIDESTNYFEIAEDKSFWTKSIGFIREHFKPKKDNHKQKKDSEYISESFFLI